MRRLILITTLVILSFILQAFGQLALADEIRLASYMKKSPARAAVKMRAAGQVRVNKSTVIHSDRILLRDIAKIEGFDEAKRKEIGQLFLARAPHPGEQRSFSDEYLRSLFNTNQTGGQWHIPNTITVERGAEKIGKDKLKKLFKEAVIRHTKLPESMIEVPKINLNKDLVVPSGQHSIRLSFAAGEKFRGRATAKVDIAVNKKRYRQYYISGDVKIYGTTVIVSKKVERGKRITMEDLRLENTVVSEAPPRMITEVADAVGMEAVTELKPGSMLTESMLKAPIIVNRGDLVTIVLEMPNLRVETKGIAKQRGARKQVIKVLNINSKKIVYGQIANDNEVHVKF